ncbi:MAG: hypothetical protein MUD08_15200 [Cytophagales bacterium]|jgi:spore maturation protein SpmA|nr:hypothetical protein [Cytophagales bacterium]
MALNYVWIAFFLIAFVVALCKYIFLGDTQIFKLIIDGTFDTAKIAIMDIALPLAGIMTFFLGILNIGERAGAIGFLSRLIGPFFNRLFPEVPKGHPASGQMMINFSANMLGLDNAATPFGLKAMQSLQELNKDKETASNAQIMFLVLHTAGPVLIPLSIMAQRALLGAANPSDVFVPCLIGTYVTTFVGMIVVGLWQRINFLHPVVLAWLLGITGAVGLLLWYLSGLDKVQLERFSQVAGPLILFVIIVAFIAGGIRKRINVFDAFIDGAKNGFEVSLKILPYLVGMLVAISVFRNSGTLDYVVNALGKFFAAIGLNTDFVPALPVALMKPFSGSGARGLMIETMKTHGADSFVGRLACIFNGSADTTFYIVALYFGSVGIKRVRYAIVAGLIADLVGVIAGIFLGYLFFK